MFGASSISPSCPTKLGPTNGAPGPAPANRRKAGWRPGLRQILHDLVKDGLRGTRALERQRRQRLVDEVQLRDEIGGSRVDVHQSGQELALLLGFVEQG